MVPLLILLLEIMWRSSVKTNLRAPFVSAAAEMGWGLPHLRIRFVSNVPTPIAVSACTQARRIYIGLDVRFA